jgi:hypothetical protein
MDCPECGNNAVSFIKAWFVGPWFHLDCPGCHAKLKVQKTGPGRFSSCILGAPIGILIALWVWDIYWSLSVFVFVAVLLLMLDLLIDRKFLILKSSPYK